MFRLVATFQECCLKALNSRERFFKVTNVLVIERSVDWRLPIQFVFCFHRDQFLPITNNEFVNHSMFTPAESYLCTCFVIFIHDIWKFRTDCGSNRSKNGYCFSGLVSEGTKLLSVPFADKFWIL